MPAIVHPDIIRWLVRHLAWLAALICHAAHVGPVPLHRGPNVSPLRAHQWFPSMQRRLSGQRGHREWHTVTLCFSDNPKIYLPPWNHHESLNNHDNNNTKHVLLSLQELCAQVSDHTSVTETLYFLFPHLLLKQSASGQINAEPITAGQHANTHCSTHTEHPIQTCSQRGHHLHSENHWRREKTGGVVTFIFLSDVLIGLHIVLLLCQPLTWVKHGHGHGLSDTEPELGHLPLSSNFLSTSHWHCTPLFLLSLCGPSVLIEALLAVCPPICLSPPSSSPTLCHCIPSIKL